MLLADDQNVVPAGLLNSLASPPGKSTARALLATATPLQNISNTNVLTPWGYPRTNASEKKSGPSTGSSWQTIRAGLLSPPPVTASLLLSQTPPVLFDEIDDTLSDAPAAGGETPDGATVDGGEEMPMGRGGWLVDLVEGWSLAPTATGPPAAPPSPAAAPPSPAHLAVVSAARKQYSPVPPVLREEP